MHRVAPPPSDALPAPAPSPASSVASVPAASPAIDAEPADTTKRSRRRWDDAPLGSKLALLLILSVAAGVFVGMMHGQLELGIGPVLLGGTLAVTVVSALGTAWIVGPIQRLVRQSHRLAAEPRPRSIHQLLGDRGDEVGQVARAMQRVCIHAIQNHHEASHLRRTLDHRIAEATQRATNQLRRLTQRDPLTDLGNRRFLEEQLDPLAEVVMGTEEDLACVMIDVDNFKAVNDTLGHAAGDELLVLLASLIQASIRGDDLAARLGGDEFAVFMPGVSAERLQSFSEMLITNFRQQARTLAPDGPWPDLSIGVATLARDGATSGHELMCKADAKLYAAKHAGKGRVTGLD